MTTATEATSAINIGDIRVNGERLWASLMELAKIGATPKGGVCRLTLTDLDKQGRDLVLRWAREAGRGRMAAWCVTARSAPRIPEGATSGAWASPSLSVVPEAL